MLQSLTAVRLLGQMCKDLHVLTTKPSYNEARWANSGSASPDTDKNCHKAPGVKISQVEMG